jgi:hypothetical protein
MYCAQFRGNCGLKNNSLHISMFGFAGAIGCYAWVLRAPAAPVAEGTAGLPIARCALQPYAPAHLDPLTLIKCMFGAYLASSSSCFCVCFHAICAGPKGVYKACHTHTTTPEQTLRPGQTGRRCFRRNSPAELVEASCKVIVLAFGETQLRSVPSSSSGLCRSLHATAVPRATAHAYVQVSARTSVQKLSGKAQRPQPAPLTPNHELTCDSLLEIVRQVTARTPRMLQAWVYMALIWMPFVLTIVTSLNQSQGALQSWMH